VNAREKNSRVLDGERAVAAKRLGIAHAEQPPVVGVLGLVELQQPVALIDLEDRAIFGQGLLLEVIGVRDIDREVEFSQAGSILQCGKKSRSTSQGSLSASSSPPGTRPQCFSRA
jgi:hypothetical protein